MQLFRNSYLWGCGGEKSNNAGTQIVPVDDNAASMSYTAQATRGMLGYMDWLRSGDKARAARHEEEKQKRIQRLRLQAAPTADDWKNAADRLDMLEGNHWWKHEEVSEECNLDMIRKRLELLKKANHDGDIERMLSLIRTSMARDLGGMCNIRLYQHTWYGTKTLIEEYTEVVKYTVDQLANHCEDASEEDIARFLTEMKAARQSFGNSALLLSGGGTLGMLHIGVVKCLLEQDLLPRIVCGSSAGSIVGAVLCCHKAGEIMAKLEELIGGDLTVFQGEDEIQGIPGMAINLLKGDPLFHIDNLCRVMRNLLGDMTFKEAYNHTGRILNIHVSCRDRHNLPRLLNYQTAPNVVVWSAVASSCALPLVFEAPGLRAKDPETNEIGPWGHIDHKWIDGSIEGDLPAQILERLFNVNNFIVSQVNPHVIPFLPREEDNPFGEPYSPGVIKKCLNFGKANMIYWLDGMMDRGWDNFPVKMAHSILSQRYDGDITILPDISWVSWLKVLANPTYEFMVEATFQGERATWPKLGRIRNHVAIELALDKGIKQIQMAAIAPRGGKVNPRTGRRAPSSIRSERDIQRWRTRSTGESTLSLRPVPGRSSTTRPIRSMGESEFLLASLPAFSTNVAGLSAEMQTSSDEHPSGMSSPTTSYDDEDFDDVKRPTSSSHTTRQSGADSSGSSTDTIRGSSSQAQPFLSQPTTPSIASKTFFFADHPPVPANKPSPGSAAAPDLKRALNDLKMSKLTSALTPFHKERKRARR